MVSRVLSLLEADDQAAALSVAPEGPGSLTRNAKGKLLVYIGVTDVSEATLGGLRSAGAEITHVSDQYLVVDQAVIAPLYWYSGLVIYQPYVKHSQSITSYDWFEKWDIVN